MKWRLFLLLLLLNLSCDNNSSELTEIKPISEREIKVFLKEYYIDIPYKTKFPDSFEYTATSGRKGSLSGHRGEVIFLNFWATWCVPCKQEMPDMEELYHLMKDEKFRMLAVAFNESDKKVGKFLKKYPYSFDIIPDQDNKIGGKFFITGLPTTLIIDKKGKLLGKAMGPRDWKAPGVVRFFKQISRF